MAKEIKYHPNYIILWEDQKKRVCDYYKCSDTNDKQYPDCGLKLKTYLDCPLHGVFYLLEDLNKERTEVGYNE